jgi:site-specific DNA recombinase
MGRLYDDAGSRDRCSKRHVMIISLAFLAPDLVRAAIDGQLPRGVGVSRLRNAPIEWSRHWRMLGLASPSAIPAAI